jgi:hypothetical protein
MDISEEKKLEILLAQLQERYEALHKMRDRSMQFVLWILGLGLGMAWLLINKTVPTTEQKYAITSLLLVLGIMVWCFVYAIYRGFKANRRIMINIEKALKLYEKDYYGTPESVLPTEFSHQKIGWAGHFSTLYMLIIIVLITLIVLTWTNLCKPESIGASATIDPNQVQVQSVINK